MSGMDWRLGHGRAWSFASALLICALLALSLHTRTARDSGTWRGHVAAGRQLLRGEVPATPAYPMWGYSFAAGALEDGVVLLQAALALVTVALWHGLLRRRRRAEGQAGSGALLLNPLVFAALMIPWLLLTTSYYSNSLGAIFLLSGTTALVFAVYERRGVALHALSALLFGLAINVRTEYLPVVLLLLASLVLTGVVGKTVSARVWGPRALAFAVVLGLCAAPWAIYTERTLDRVQLGSTNAGGVMYLNLGIDPANPWGITADDRFVHEIAREKFGTRAWTLEAGDHFRREYVRAALTQPVAFLLRVLRGWRLMLIQGLYLPPVEDIFTLHGGDAQIADHLNERLKGALGFPVNRRQVLEYERLGLERPSLRHYALVLGEYGVRILFLAAMLGLLALALASLARRGLSDFMSLVFLSYGVCLLLTAGLVQTLPRHTTPILPILIGCAALAGGPLLPDPLTRALRRAARGRGSRGDAR